MLQRNILLAYMLMYLPIVLFTAMITLSPIENLFIRLNDTSLPIRQRMMDFLPHHTIPSYLRLAP
jgi:hypothetical protein